MVDKIGHGCAAGAKPSLVIGVSRVALHMVDLSVATVDEHAAPKVAPWCRPGASSRDVEIAVGVAPRMLLCEAAQAALGALDFARRYDLARSMVMVQGFFPMGILIIAS